MVPISLEERKLALLVARRALEAYFSGRPLPACSTNSPGLAQLRGVFVTLRRLETGELRGCRGECQPVRPLIDSVIRQTISAAVGDPRFTEVGAQELRALTIRINALTPLFPIEPQAIVLGRHGLLIKTEGRSGILLPEVPAQHGLRTTVEFLELLHRKAGLAHEPGDGAIDELYAFETESWDDEAVAREGGRGRPPRVHFVRE
jgi:AmmeMemoRadiSam system protein A